MMNQENTSLLKVGDFFLVAFIILGSFLFVYQNIVHRSQQNQQLVAIILKDNHIVKTLDLRQNDLNQFIELNDEYPVKIEAQYGKIRFSHSDCPDKLCIAAGWLSHQGDTAICLPAKVILKIERNRQLIDSVSY